MVALFYLFSLFLGGVALAGLLRLRLNLEGRLVTGAMLGQVGGVWLLYILSIFLGRLSYLSIIITALLFMIPVIVSLLFPGMSLRKKLSEFKKDFSFREGFSLEFLSLILLLSLFFTWLNLHAILLPDSQGNLYATEHVWADTPFHVSIIQSFLYRDNFPSVYPVLKDAPLRYPFLVDFHTAALIKGGLSLRQGIVVSNILLQVSLFLAIYLIGRELTGSRKTGFISSLVFLFLGNFGFILAWKDISTAGGFFAWLQNLPWSYTGSAIGIEGRERIGVGLYLGNPVYLFFMPRRAATFGMALSMVLMLILLKLVQNRTKETGFPPFVAAGFLLGSLPRIHAHSFLVMGIFTGFVILSSPWWKVLNNLTPFIPLSLVRNKVGSPPSRVWSHNSTHCFWTKHSRLWTLDSRLWTLDSRPFKWGLLLFVAFLVALPQLWGLREQVGGSFFKFWLGWIGEPHDAFEKLGRPGLSSDWHIQFPGALVVFIKFWAWNMGLLLLLLPFALWRASRNERLFYIPFILIFLLGNLIKVQPWEWDNNNFFLYWQVGSVILIASLLGKFSLQRVSSPWGFLSGPLVKAIKLAGLSIATGTLIIRGFFKIIRTCLLFTVCCLLFATLIMGGVLNIIRTGQEKNFLWSASEVKLGQWIRENTPPGSLVLTGSAHNHPIPSLGGRQIVMGFEGWLFSHGLSYEKVLQDEIKMFQGDISLLKDYGIDYVALTPYEYEFARAKGFTINEAIFKDLALFELVYEEKGQGRWRIYRFRR